jgi:hypothetical protein
MSYYTVNNAEGQFTNLIIQQRAKIRFHNPRLDKSLFQTLDNLRMLFGEIICFRTVGIDVVELPVGRILFRDIAIKPP